MAGDVGKARRLGDIARTKFPNFPRLRGADAQLIANARGMTPEGESLGIDPTTGLPMGLGFPGFEAKKKREAKMEALDEYGAIPKMRSDNTTIFGTAGLRRGGFLPNFSMNGTIVPGAGNGDTVKAMLPKGGYVLNKKATAAITAQRGGGIFSVGSAEVPARVEPGEMVLNNPSPEVKRGADYLNNKVSRHGPSSQGLQEGGPVGLLGGLANLGGGLGGGGQEMLAQEIKGLREDMKLSTQVDVDASKVNVETLRETTEMMVKQIGQEGQMSRENADGQNYTATLESSRLDVVHKGTVSSLPTAAPAGMTRAPGPDNNDRAFALLDQMRGAAG